MITDPTLTGADPSRIGLATPVCVSSVIASSRNGAREVGRSLSGIPAGALNGPGSTAQRALGRGRSAGSPSALAALSVPGLLRSTCLLRHARQCPRAAGRGGRRMSRHSRTRLDIRPDSVDGGIFTAFGHVPAAAHAVLPGNKHSRTTASQAASAVKSVLAMTAAWATPPLRRG